MDKSDIRDIKKELEHDLDSKRYEHTLGVAYTAACLAMRYGYDMEKAYITGLLHDCAKCMDDNKKIDFSPVPVAKFSELVSDELLGKFSKHSLQSMSFFGKSNDDKTGEDIFSASEKKNTATAFAGTAYARPYLSSTGLKVLESLRYRK